MAAALELKALKGALSILYQNTLEAFKKNIPDFKNLGALSPPDDFEDFLDVFIDQNLDRLHKLRFGADD